MSRKRLITAINKDPREDQHNRIRRFGGRFLDGGLLDTEQWRASDEEAIDLIRSGDEFFVLSWDGKTRIPVSLQTSRYGYPCLQSAPNGLLGDNLLSLPELPGENALVARGLMNSSLNALAKKPGYGVGLINSPVNRLAALAAGLKAK